MATNIKVLPNLSPRIIKILAPITIISIQDLTNQIKDWEDEPSNLSYPVLVATSGKESLGGGTSVGITAELQNAQVMFEARTESDAIGTYTASDYPDPSGTILIDDNAVFTYIISPGDTVINMVTGAVATILSIDSAIQITHEPLDDGTNNFWSYGDDYKIWNKIQCEINGGNLVAVDTAGADQSPFLPSAFTHVIRTSASSATLQEQEDIQFSAFSGGIWVDAVNGTAGTTFPAGTPRQPVDNIDDALTISTARGLNTLFFIGDFTFVSGDNVSLKQVRGESVSKSTLTFESGAVTAGTEFFDTTVEGFLVSPSGFTDCQLLDVTGNTIGVSGTIVLRNCAFGGTITLSNALIGNVHILDCKSGVSGATTPVFDANGAQVDVLVRNYAGGMEIHGITYQYSDFSIDMVSGTVILSSTNTAGSMTIRGISNLIDNSGVGLIVDTSGLVFANELQLSAFNEKVSVDISNGVAGTEFPLGTRANPVNNVDDAITIANARGITTLFVVGALTLDTGDEITNFTILGQNTNQTQITINTGAVTNSVEYRDAFVTGVLDGGSIIRNCIVSDIDFFNGTLSNTMINPGTITLGGGTIAHILDCFSGVPGLSTPIIDMGGSGQGMGVRNYNGGIRLINKTGSDAVSIDMSSGQVILNSTVTNGTIVIRGIAKLTDNATTGATINTEGLIFADQSQLASFSEKITIDVLLGTSGVRFPQGTAQFPVSNIDDALAIANARGISTLFAVGNLEINYNDDISKFTIEGQSISSSEVTLVEGCITEGTKFLGCTVVGAVGGTVEMERCELGEPGEDLTNVGTAATTIFRDCIIHNITLSPTASGEFLMLDCKSGDPADAHPNHPVLDHNNSTAGIGIRNYTGGIHLKNISDPYGIHTIDMLSGFVHIDATCTDGQIVVRGLTLIEDDSSGATVEAAGVMAEWDQLLADHRIPGSFGQRLTDILKLKRTQP